MNGLGMQKQTFKINMIGSLICIATITLLIPKKGIVGFVLAMLLQSGFVCCNLLFYVLKFVELRIDLKHWILTPCVAALISSFIAITFNRCLFVHTFPISISTIFSILTLGITYLMCLILMGSFSIKDIKSFIGAK